MSEKAGSIDSREAELVAWFCWAAPAATGVAATVFNAPTIGAWTLVFGLGWLIPGVVALKSLRRRRRLLALLLLSNFPLALVCIVIGARSLDGPGVARIDVVNKSTVQLDSVVVTFAGRSKRSDGVAVGRTRTVASPPIEDRDDLLLSVNVPGKQFTFKLGNIDSDDISGVRIVEVHDDGIRWAEPRWRD